jgi:hypothetical protein
MGPIENIAGAFDCIVMNINNALKYLITGQYIAFSDAIHGIAAQTMTLKDDVMNKLAKNERDIEYPNTEKDGVSSGK